MDERNSFQDFSNRAIELNQTTGHPKRRMRTEVPIYQKGLLTLEEAAEYTGLGVNKLRSMSNGEDCPFVLWNWTKRMFKRRKLDAYLDDAYSI